MQYVRQAGSDPSFLLKALSEGSGELRRCFYSLRRRELLRPSTGDDEDWCLMAIPFHMLQVERGVTDQFERMLSSREPEIRHVDLDDIPFREDYVEADEDELLEEFHYLRRRTSYMLWDLSPSEWERGGIHPYRQRLTVLEVTRELYQHDLEHLWQARRMLDALAGALR
jgi:hypothetical protein